ncbi:hypothetical protein XELAEV_18036796mg [Xenopus laevis]|uniref:Uncharacterized protein n=1 Tax=Xenopus laevis TaxID=8355 RepID=A0A974HA13_XENLA|nr:hypothetical protein XELAEV_18036796mg [Xenopus laevis]
MIRGNWLTEKTLHLIVCTQYSKELYSVLSCLIPAHFSLVRMILSQTGWSDGAKPHPKLQNRFAPCANIVSGCAVTIGIPPQ